MYTHKTGFASGKNGRGYMGTVSRHIHLGGEIWRPYQPRRLHATCANLKLKPQLYLREKWGHGIRIDCLDQWQRGPFPLGQGHEQYRFWSRSLAWSKRVEIQDQNGDIGRAKGRGPKGRK